MAKYSTDPSSVHKELSYGEKIAKIGLVVTEIFGRLVQQRALVTLALSWVTGPNVTKIVHNVEKFMLFNILKSEL